MRKRYGLSIALAVIAGGMLLAAGPPATPKRPVADTLHGVKVVDHYRWLENWNNPEVRRWTEAQNAYARGVLDKLPNVESIGRRLSQIAESPHPDWFDVQFRRGLLFALEMQPPRQQPFLVVMTTPGEPASERIVLDPAALDPSGATSIDFYAPSLDARLVAVSLSTGGTERGDLRVYDAASGKALPDVVPRVNGGTAGGSVAWNADASGFYYTRYPRPGERPDADLDFYQQVYFHKLGTPTTADTYVIGRQFPRIAEIQLQSSEDGRFVLARVANGDGGQFAFHLLDASAAGAKWARIAGLQDGITSAAFAPDSQSLYLVSHAGAPRGKIVEIRLGAALSPLSIVVPEGDAAIESVTPTAGALFVREIAGGPSRLEVFSRNGSARGDVPLPPVSTVSQIVRLNGDEVLMRGESYVDPPAWYRVGVDARIARTALAFDSPADFSGIEAVREEGTSTDGTKVPMTILRRKGLPKDPRTPALLYGYGGYDISLRPSFAPSRLVWLEQGGIYAEANLRGGGEFGDAWHQAGRLTKKQNVFDDFAACARRLVEAGYTSPAKLAIEGGSNGGLLMGAELTQHPEQFHAVVSHVGIYDMLRFERFPNGQFNTTEFGTVKDPVQFKALLAYSPYQHVVDRTRYPAVLLLSGTNDPRVNPADSRKMAARLQAATASGLPVLLRVSGGGHGIGASLGDRVAQELDVLAFLFAELGAPFVPVR